MSSNNHDIDIIRSKALAQALAVSDATLWRMGKRGELPPRVQISKGISGWRKADIATMLEQRATR